VKRLGRDELMWVAIHICMETTQGISLYSYLYLKLAKVPCFYYFLYFFLLQNQRTREQNRFSWRWGGVAQILYIHVSKCKNDNIKKEKKEKKD
jgi:hypothetical protein